MVKLKLNHIEMSGNGESWQDEVTENDVSEETNGYIVTSQGCLLQRLKSEEEERNYLDDIDPEELIAKVFRGR